MYYVHKIKAALWSRRTRTPVFLQNVKFLRLWGINLNSGYECASLCQEKVSKEWAIIPQIPRRHHHICCLTEYQHAENNSSFRQKESSPCRFRWSKQDLFLFPVGARIRSPTDVISDMALHWLSAELHSLISTTTALTFSHLRTN